MNETRYVWLSTTRYVSNVNWVCYQSTTIWAISLKESGLKILGQATYHLHIAVINPVSTSFNSTFSWRGSIDGKGPTIWQLNFSGTPTYNCNLTQKVKITKFIEFIKKQVCTCKSDIIIPIKCQVKMSKIPSFSNCINSKEYWQTRCISG